MGQLQLVETGVQRLYNGGAVREVEREMEIETGFRMYRRATNGQLVTLAPDASGIEPFARISRRMR